MCRCDPGMGASTVPEVLRLWANACDTARSDNGSWLELWLRQRVENKGIFNAGPLELTDGAP